MLQIYLRIRQSDKYYRHLPYVLNQRHESKTILGLHSKLAKLQQLSALWWIPGQPASKVAVKVWIRMVVHYMPLHLNENK